MDNSLSTDKQLTSIIQNTEWIDLTPNHKKLRNDLEQAVKTSCIENRAINPIMIKGAFGIGKTATLHYMFHYAWTKLEVPAFILKLNDVLTIIKNYLNENGLHALPNEKLSEIVQNIIEKQRSVLKLNSPEKIKGGDIYFDDFGKKLNLSQYLDTFQPADVFESENGDFTHSKLPLFTSESINKAISNCDNSLLLIDEFETYYGELKNLLVSSGGGELRQFFDDVTSASKTNYYCIIGNGPASGAELSAYAKEKSNSDAAQARRLFVKQIQMPTVNSLSKSFLKESPKEYINFIWWLSRSRPGQIKKLKDNLQTLEDLNEHNYIQFLRENTVLNEHIDDIGESNVTFLKTELVEDLSIPLKNLFKSTLINLGPYELDIIDEKYKEELSVNKELFYASAELTKVSDIITSLQEDIINIRDNSKKYSQVNFDSLHSYIDLILSSISNQNEEIVFGVINKSDVDEYLSKLFLTPLFSNLYDFITIYEDEHDRKVKILLDFILELIYKSENEDSETLFPSSFDLFERGSVRIKNRDKINVQLNIKSIRETIEQPIGSPRLPYKTDSLEEKISRVDSIKKIFIWNKNDKEEIIIIPNYDNDVLLESYIENLKTYFQENWTENKDYFGDGELISNVVYLEESDLVSEFKDWLCNNDGSEELPYKLKRLDVKQINSCQIHNSQRISDFISSLTKIATIGLFNSDIQSKDLIKFSDKESETIARIDKIVDLILDTNWTESKQTRRTIEYYKDLLLTGGNSAFESLTLSARNTFSSSIEEIIPIIDKIKKHLLDISIEDRIFEEAYSVQTKNLFNFLISEIKKEEISTIKQILKSAREFRFRPSLENKEKEVSLTDLFFSVEKNKNIDKNISDYHDSSIAKYLDNFSKLLSEYIEIDTLSDFVDILFEENTIAASYSKSLNFYESNIPYLNGFYYNALSKKLVYETELKSIKEELLSVQEEFNNLESELSDKLYDLKELTNEDAELNYNTELRLYNTSLIQPLLNLFEYHSNISFLIITQITINYLKNTLKRANRFKNQIDKIVGDLEVKKSAILIKQNEYDEIFSKSIIHKKLIAENKTGDFFYSAKFVKSFKYDNSYNQIFGDINKFKPSDKYYIDDNEFQAFIANLKKSYDKKLQEINQELEEVKNVDEEIEQVLKLEESIETLLNISDNE